MPCGWCPVEVILRGLMACWLVALAVGGSMALAVLTAVGVQPFGFLPGMAFTGDSENGDNGEEQSGPVHKPQNLAAFCCLFNFHFSKSGIL